MPPGLPKPRAFLFDLDGTLVDSFADIATALNETRARHDLPPLPPAEIRAQVGSGSEYLVRQLVPVAEADFAATFAFYLERYEHHALDETRLFPGAMAVLERYGDRPLAVVTNKTAHLAQLILAGLGVRERFRLVLGGDSLARRKPDPLPVRHVLQTFAVSAEEAVLVGDGLHDIHAGRAAGVGIVAVTTGVESHTTLAAERPDHVIPSLDALLQLYA